MYTADCNAISEDHMSNFSALEGVQTEEQLNVTRLFASRDTRSLLIQYDILNYRHWATWQKVFTQAPFSVLREI